MKHLLFASLVLSAVSAMSCPKTIEIKNTQQSEQGTNEGEILMLKMTQSAVLQRVDDTNCYYESSPGAGAVKTNLYADIQGDAIVIYLGDTTVAPSKEELEKTQGGVSDARFAYKISPATALAPQKDEILMSYYLLDGGEGISDYVTRSESGNYGSKADPTKPVGLTQYELIITQDDGSKQLVKK